MTPRLTGDPGPLRGPVFVEGPPMDMLTSWFLTGAAILIAMTLIARFLFSR